MSWIAVIPTWISSFQYHQQLYQDNYVKKLRQMLIFSTNDEFAIL